MQAQKRNGAIDFWKFIFSLVIVCFHTFHYESLNGMQPFKGGNSAVEFFFLVSGFLMAQSASRVSYTEGSLGKETARFISRKIKGLYPEFAVAWIMAFIVMHLSARSWAVTTLIKDFLTGIWELCLLRMSGLAGYRANVVTWYISAMILAMLILYPLLIKYKDTFFVIIAPCISLFLLGYMYQAFGNMGGGTVWEGFYYRGMISAFADMSLGCISWKMCQAIRQYDYTKLARIFFSAIELGGYLFCIYWMFGHSSSNMSFVLLMIFLICVPITFSHVGLLSGIFDNNICYTLGKASFSLYIGHIFWIKSLEKFFPSYIFEKRLIVLFICVTSTAVMIMKISDLVRKVMPSVIARTKKLMIKL